MIIDASALYAYFVRDSRAHWNVYGEIELAGREELMVSPFSIAALEAMISDRIGRDAWLAALEELGGGAWSIAHADPIHLGAVRERSAETLEHASALVLAEKYGVELVSAR